MNICKWGNSLGLRIPAAVAQVAGLRHGSPVSVRLLDNGSLLVIPRHLHAVDGLSEVPASIPLADKW